MFIEVGGKFFKSCKRRFVVFSFPSLSDLECWVIKNREGGKRGKKLIADEFALGWGENLFAKVTFEGSVL